MKKRNQPDLHPIAAKILPLDYLLSVIADSSVDAARRDRLAIIALPYCHSRMSYSEVGKKLLKKRRSQKQALEEGTEWQDEMKDAA